MRTRVVEFKCDWCSKTSLVKSNSQGEEESLPDGWAKFSMGHSSNGILENEICAPCKEAIAMCRQNRIKTRSSRSQILSNIHRSTGEVQV